MEVTEKYANLVERKQKVALREGQGMRMLHDNFDASWQPKQEPHGTMTFTDQVGPTLEELAEQTKATKQAEAKTRAVTAILANKTGAPWGVILFDLAVAQGLVEPV